MNHYELHAYVVMANQVHLLITPSVAVSKVMHSLKRFTARKANELFKLTGRPFWQDESYDHRERSLIMGWVGCPPKRSSGLAPGPIANRPGRGRDAG
ncbi:MAG: transposase [Bryobacteraceae bacterium]